MTDPVAARLAQMRDRLADATEGPWSRHDFGYAGEQEPSSIVVHTGKFDWKAVYDGETVVASMGWDAPQDADAEFIAHARTDLPDLLGAVQDVLALHQEYKRPYVSRQATTNGTYIERTHFVPACCACQTESGRWPCPTVTAITARLGEA